MPSGFLYTCRVMRVSNWQRSSSGSSSRSLMEKLPRARRAINLIRSKPGVPGNIGQRGRVVAIWWGNRLPVEALRANLRSEISKPQIGLRLSSLASSNLRFYDFGFEMLSGFLPYVICDNPGGNGHDPPKTRADDTAVAGPLHWWLLRGVGAGDRIQYRIVPSNIQDRGPGWAELCHIGHGFFDVQANRGQRQIQNRVDHRKARAGRCFR